MKNRSREWVWECTKCGVKTNGGLGHVRTRAAAHACRVPPLRMPWGVLWLTGGLAALLCLLSLLSL